MTIEVAIAVVIHLEQEVGVEQIFKIGGRTAIFSDSGKLKNWSFPQLYEIVNQEVTSSVIDQLIIY